MTAKDIFGFSHDDLAEAAAAVERALGIRLKLHESHYQGDYFEGETASGQRLVLQRNLDPMHDAKSDPPEERFFEHQYPDVPLLLYVDGEAIDDLQIAIQTNIKGIRFLERRVIS